jgi:hypothetical protein
MTEAEWLACTEPKLMLTQLHGDRVDGGRQRRLLACASCRLIWHLLREEKHRKAVEVSERYADGMADLAELSTASLAAHPAGSSIVSRLVSVVAYATCFVDFVLPETVEAAVRIASLNLANERTGVRKAAKRTARSEVQARQCELMRDIFGNPFRPAALDPAWRTPVVVALATATYEERILPAGTLDLQRLAVLADALEDAGCTDTVILAHLREPNPHVRGCWAIDLLLGKE